MSDQPGDAFEESGIFNASLSMWKGVSHINKDGTFCYEDDEFEPIPLDLHTAASIGETEIVRDLLERKAAKINTLNKGGWSSLMYASYMGHEKTILSLLQLGANTNQCTRQGSTPLILAAMCGYYNVMPCLLQNGANLEAKDNRGWTALFHAASSGHQQTTEFLIKAGANCEVVEPQHHMTPVMEAAASGHEFVVELLLQRGVDISRVDTNGDNARSLAAEYGHLEVVELIDNFKMPKRTSSSKGQNIYHQAQHNHRNQSNNNNYGSSGPSIHDGPKAFAEMTGLGADGKPKPNSAMPSLLQDPSPQPVHVGPQQLESRWKGPKDLPTLLEEISCSKHLPIFKEQDIDLRVFLTLTEAELKEIGIKLFGPRRKMVATIARINSSIQASLIDKTELAYCDSLLFRMKELDTKLKEMQENNADLSAQLAQERQLRSVAESVLMEQKESGSAIHRCVDKIGSEHGRMVVIADQFRSFCVRSNQSKNRHQSNHSTQLPNNSSRMIDQEFPKLSQEFDSVLHHTRDYLMEIQRLLQMQQRSCTDPNRHAVDRQGLKMQPR